MDFPEIEPKTRNALIIVSSMALLLLFVASSLGSTSPPNQIKKVERVLGAGNMGTHTFYYVYLENDTRITYDYYQTHHPLCPENPEKCGEDSKDAGWDQIDNMVNSTKFAKETISGVATFIPKNSICMKSRTRYSAC